VVVVGVRAWQKSSFKEEAVDPISSLSFFLMAHGQQPLCGMTKKKKVIHISGIFVFKLFSK
jgi:hypothetical protein